MADALAARPKLVLLVAGVVTVFAATRALRLEVTTSRTNLGHATTPAEEAFGHFLHEFGSPNDVIVAIDAPPGTGAAELRAAADDLAAALERDPTHVRSTFHRVDLDYFLGRLLLFTPKAELHQVRQVLEAEFVQKVREGRAGGIDAMLDEFTAVFSGRMATTTMDNGRATAALDALAIIAREVDARLKDPTRKGIVGFRELVPPLKAGSIDDAGYLQSRDGAIRVVFVRPAVPSDENSVVLPMVSAIRRIASEVAARHAGMRLRVTGLPAIQADETVIVDHDIALTTLVSILLIGAVLLYGYRRPQQVLLSLVPLLAGIVWTLAWVQFQFGRVNLVASAFAPILMGRGSDFAIYLIARYNAARAEGASPREAVRHSLLASGGMITGALVTTLAFLLAAIGQFGMFLQLGLVVGVGLLLVLGASLIITPPLLLVLGERRLPGDALTERILSAVPAFGRGPGALALRRPGTVVGLGVAGVALLALYVRRPAFDYDLLKLLPQGTESVGAQTDLSTRSDYGSDVVVVTTSGVEEARAKAEALARLPNVGRVESIASFLPADQETKVQAIAGMRPLVENIPPIERPSPPTSPEAFGRSLEALADTIDDRVFAVEQAQHPLRVPLRTLAQAVEGLDTTLRELPREEAALRVAALEGGFFDLLARARALLRQNVEINGPVTLADLPRGTRERFMGEGGRSAVYVFPKKAGAGDELTAFVGDVRSVAPHATGFPVIYFDSSRAVFRGLVRSSGMAFVVVLVAIFLHFRRVRPTLLTLVPLSVAGIAMAALMKTFGIPHNMANIVALPLLIGLGTDYGLQLVHHAEAFPEASLHQVLRETGLGVFLAGGTTAAGFGALGLARHLGGRSLGLELLLGTLAAMVGALIVLPGILALLRRDASPGARRDVEEPVRRSAEGS